MAGAAKSKAAPAATPPAIAPVMPFPPGAEIGGGGTNGGGGENGGDPGQGRPVTGPQRFMLLAKLMGVKREKEPLSGTGPERRLFDRSLTCSAVILVSGMGMEPVRLLLLSRRKRSFDSLPKESGIRPVKLFK
nr:hypothetical protein Iba_chr14dCG16990 [Ipomoea batatas]